MNIVKGVADFIWRSSSAQTGEYTSVSASGRFPLPMRTISFSDVGDEAILKALWEKYLNAAAEAEKRKLLHIFLKQFLTIFQSWKPFNIGHVPEEASTSTTVEYTKNVGEVAVGCSFGHPAEVILVMTDEVSLITRVLTNRFNILHEIIGLPPELVFYMHLLGHLSHSAPDQLGFTKNMSITTESLMALDALTMATLSIHNCKVLGHHAGIQKLTTLMKAAIIQLKTIASALQVDGSLLNTMVQNARTLQNILVIVVSIICNFVDFPSSIEENFQSNTTNAEFSSKRSAGIFTKPSAEVHSPISEAILSWHQVAVVSVMEAGGLNWLLEILRLMRRLTLKEQWVEKSLQHLTLRALWSALADNPRGQNHFRSIGGLEVLLDGLGVQSIDSLISYDSSSSVERSNNQLQDVFNLHVVSLEVLREAVFGNFNNLQFLCENGRVQKFANSFCSLAFMIQDYRCFRASRGGDFVDDFNRGKRNASEECKADLSDPNQYHPSFVQHWKDYVTRLSSALCHFLLEAKDIKIFSVQPNSSRNTIMVSPVYAELSLKWFTRVLLTVFPCIRACSDQEEIPSHLRIFALTMQQYVLLVFKRVLLSLPSLIEVFRAEGVWDFMFSENFFYFGQTPAEYYPENCLRDVPYMDAEGCSGSSSVRDQVDFCDIGKFQVEVLTLMDFAASLSGSTHNLPECTVLLDALEHSAFTPELATALGKSLLHILKLSTEKTVSSFKTLGAIPRLLKVASIQVQESKKFNANASPATEAVESCQDAVMSCSPMVTQSWGKCMRVCIELFEMFFSVSEDAKYSILCNSLSISCIFDLFWEEGLRNLMLKYVLELMKVVPSSEEDKKAKVFLCSKYFETFTHLKERIEDFAGPSVKLLVSMRALLETDQAYYQALFREGECFLHIVSLLNGNLDVDNGENLVLNVLQTLTCLLSMNDASKAAFRALVGGGYQTFRSLLLDFYQWQPSEALLSSLLDMLVDGSFDLKLNYVIKNEDAILLYLSFLHKSSDSLQRCGLDLLLNMLRDSLSNRASCVRAGMLEFLLNWVSEENNNTLCSKIAQLIQVIGGHSISGKDIRKIFAMLRNGRTCLHDHSSSLLLTSMLAMMNEKGPTAFFDLNGINSGIVIKKPVQLPVSRGYSFTCWLSIESFPRDGPMALFSFFTETGRGCYAVLVKDKLIYESINQKRQCASVNISIIRKKWHFLCFVHSVGGAFSGGSQLKCYLNGALVCSEKCSYPKINEALTSCAIGTKLNPPLLEEENLAHSVKECYPFLGQIGPTYLFSDALSPDQVQGIFSLGPSYMYYFLDNGNSFLVNKVFAGGVRDAKDGLGSKIMFGINAQASNNRALFNVSPTLESAIDKEPFEANVLVGTQLCSRRLLQEIIYCVGGVSVFFPLLVQSDMSEGNRSHQVREIQLAPITNGHLTALTIKLIASTLDDSFANQQQMLLLSGFSIIGFLLQSVPTMRLNLETLSALKHLFTVVANGGLSELLVKDVISCIFLNPHIWVGAVYEVQRELYMFLIQQFDNDRTLLKSLCRLPRVLDIIRQFYFDSTEMKSAVGSKAILHAMADQSFQGKPHREEIRKIRLLLLSLGEMSVREDITASDIKALVAFFETCQDVASLEDILNMIIRAICQKQLLSSFLEQVHLVGGCVIFVNLLKSDYEPVRLLALQFIGRLLLGLPVEKKGSRFFSILVGRNKYLTEGHGKTSLDVRLIFSLISARIFEFQQTDLLCDTLFDVLLGGASPKQVLRKHNQSDQRKSSKNNAEFFLPQVLPLIFRFLSGCEDRSSRTKIMGDLLDLLNSNPSNIEALMDNGWNDWLFASVKLDVIKNYRVKMQGCDDSEMDEKQFVMNMYSLVLCHLILCVKGGWQDLEETVNFLLSRSALAGISYQYFLRDIYEDLIQKLISLSSEDHNFVSLPCRDNILYLLKLVDEMLISEMDYRLPFPSSRAKFPQFLELDDCLDFSVVLSDAWQGEPAENISGSPGVQNQPDLNENEKTSDAWWNIYDKLWVLIGKMNVKEPSKVLPRSSSLTMPSLTQRARGLVESLNIPATEMAAAMSGGIGNALVGKPNRTLDKAMQLRGERCSRFVYRLTIFYLCRSSLERASQCVQHVVTILPSVLAVDDEQNKSRLQLFIWTLLAVRSLYGMLDGGARFHVISSLIRETINYGKPMLVASISGGDDLSELFASSKQLNTISNFLQKDRLLGAVANEVKYINKLKAEKTLQLNGLRSKMEESIITDADQKNALGKLIESSLHAILASDDFRRSSHQLSMDEEQHIIAEKWIHTLRLLIDERGPWSANPFPNSIVAHWKLDKTEDAWRRRQKLRRNYHFDEQLCHPSSMVSGDIILPSTNDGKFGLGALALEKIKQFSLKGIQRIADEAFSEPIENEAQSSQEKISETKDFSGPYSDVMTEKTEQDILHDREEYTSLKESENSEVLMIIPCVLVNPKRKLAGRLAIMKGFLNFYGEYLIEGTGGSSALKTYCSLGNVDSGKLEDLVGPQKQNFDSERSSLDENFISVNRVNELQLKKCTKRRLCWNMFKIKAVHWTRYLLRYTAIEIFFINSAAPIFFNFGSQKVAQTVGSLIVSTRDECISLKGLKEKTGVISFVDRRLAQEMAETARESWRRREITNFEYLMVLNTLAGRSYSDITQYPVFPWVLADYCSETLDLKKSSTFRDLSKPIGALDPKRFEVFEDRYHNFTDPDIPSFYYGSHYSSMGIVLFYLLRLEPFTALHRNLQGGKFDHADRLFQSIEGTYKNCLSNTSDVKELIPEFFYMPEFLMNSNSYHFGIKQDGEPIGDVCLPPWAKGSPEEFINRNREALESEYVSSNLHHWIDLVFGYKQRGKPAVEGANIFYYLTYEGAVDLENMEDDLQRSAIEDQIANFGQTPIQIFRKKHPRRGPPIPIAHPLIYAPGAINLTSVVSSMSNSPSAVLYVSVLDSCIVTVNQGLFMSVRMWLTTQLQSGGNFTFSGSQDPIFGIGSDVLSPCKIGSHLAANFELGAQSFATLQTPSENFLISCGNWENSFQVISLGDGRVLQSVRYHKDIVSCVAVTADGNFLATASYDTTVMVWEILRVRTPRSRNMRTDYPLKDCVIAEAPFHILCGHDDVISCLHASAELDLVISGSKDGTCVFHTLQTGRYVRSLRHPSGRPLSKLTASRHGQIVLYADDLNLHLYSINGRHISSVESNGRLSSIELSCCDNFLVCAGDQGQIIVRSMNSLEVLMKYAGIGKPISSLTVTREECFIAGTEDGELLVYSVENPPLRKSGLQRNSKTKSSMT